MKTAFLFPGQGAQHVGMGRDIAEQYPQAAALFARANDILVRSPRSTIYSRLVEGRFPKWREVLPERSESVMIEIAVGPLHSAVRQAAIVTSEESRGVDFTFGEGSKSTEKLQYV